MRKCAIINSLGERWPLDDPANYWLNALSGLGMQMNRTYASLEPGFWAETASDEAQVPIEGTLVFRRGDVYKKFQDAANWLMTSEGLQFEYIASGSTAYYKGINVDVISKGERLLSRWLECPVLLTPLSPWYDKYLLSFEFYAPPAENYKRYGYRYEYRYASSSQANSKDFQIDGHYPGEVELRADGPLSAPVIILSDTFSGEIYGKLDLHSVSVGTGEALYYSSRTNNPGIWKIIGGDKVDIIDELELSADTESFFRVPQNKPVTATMSVDGSIEGRAVMSIYKYYRLR